MAEAVTDAIIEAIDKHMTQEDRQETSAAEYVNAMKDAGRFNQDIFGKWLILPITKIQKNQLCSALNLFMYRIKFNVNTVFRVVQYIYFLYYIYSDTKRFHMSTLNNILVTNM